MYIVPHSLLPPLPGTGQSRLVAEPGLGVRAFEVRLQSLAPGEGTAELVHDGELVVLALSGFGKLLIDGGPLRFAAPCTLLPPPGCPFGIANQGTAALQLAWVYTAAPRAPTHRAPRAGG